jgi:hypothetical protein
MSCEISASRSEWMVDPPVRQRTRQISAGPPRDWLPPGPLTCQLACHNETINHPSPVTDRPLLLPCALPSPSIFDHPAQPRDCTVRASRPLYGPASVQTKQTVAAMARVEEPICYTLG